MRLPDRRSGADYGHGKLAIRAHAVSFTRLRVRAGLQAGGAQSPAPAQQFSVKKAITAFMVSKRAA
jgi:hypothetical protein